MHRSGTMWYVGRFRCGHVKMEPFVPLSVFFSCLSSFLSNLRPILVIRTSVVLLGFLLFCRLRNYCAIVAPVNSEKQEKVPGNQLLMGTIALPFVNYCVTIAQLLHLFP